MGAASGAKLLRLEPQICYTPKPMDNQSGLNRWDLEKLAESEEENLALAEQGIADWAEALDAEDHEFRRKAARRVLESTEW